jgi:hypothetical protein
MTPKDCGGANVDEFGFAVYRGREEAVEAGINDVEFSRIFRSVDQVHPYT